MDTQQLVRAAFGPQAELTKEEGMEKGASSRRYRRLHLAGDGVPSSAVLMELPDEAMKSDEQTAGSVPGELPFINMQKAMAACGLPVPRVYLDAVRDGAVLLEDLGVETLNARIAGRSAEEVEDWYAEAADLLARMHQSMWPVPAGCQAQEREFDFSLLRWELDHYREWGIEALRGQPLATPEREALDGAFDELAREVAALPRGFVHRDYQSRNLMVTGPTPRARHLSIIDFQDGLQGPRVYDLVALLNDSYVDLPPDVQSRVIERYARRTRIPRGEVQYEFDIITVQRKLKDGGRFVFIDRVKGDPSYLPFVEKSFLRVRRVLERLPGHGELKSALAAADPVHFG